MNEEIELTIVLPTYEEADNLRSILPKINKVLPEIIGSYEILVVDSFSTRDSAELVCRQHQVRYIRQKEGERYGDAVRTAITCSFGKMILIMDADGSHNPDALPILIGQKDHADLIVGSRYVKGGKTENPVILILMSLTVNIIFRLVLNLSCRDVSTSFRLYKTKDLRSLELICNHFDIVEEILIGLIYTHPNYRVLEVPITFEKRKAGKTKRQLVLFTLGYLELLVRLYFLRRRFMKSQRTHL